MELDEVVGRVLGRHKVLVSVCVLVGLLVALGLQWGHKPLYAASARLVIGTQDATSSAQAQALADTVYALATGTTAVAQALSQVGVDRDPVTVANDHVQVQALGSSAVIELTVTDPDPNVAVQLAGALARDVVAARTQGAQAAVTQALSDLDAQIESLQGQIKSTDAAAAGLAPQIGSAVPTVSNRATAERDQLAAQSLALSGQLDVLLAQRGNIHASSVDKPTAAVVDTPTAPAVRVPGRLLADLAVGALLGLLVGVAIAAILESLRPSVVGRSALARSIHAPVLAELSGSPDSWSVPELAEAAMHVEMAAAGADVRRVELIGGDRRTDLGQLTLSIGAAAPRITVSHVDARAARGAGSAQPQGSVTRGISRDENGRHGLVAVVPSAIRLSELDRIKDFVAISGWPLLGVIVCNGSSRHSTRVPEPVASEEIPA